jgi:hypothetical protein
MESLRTEWNYDDIVTYLTRTYKADLDRASLLKNMGKLQQGSQAYRHFHRSSNDLQRDIANASGGQYESTATQIDLFKSKIDPDLLFQITLKWNEQGETSHRALVVNSDKATTSSSPTRTGRRSTRQGNAPTSRPSAARDSKTDKAAAASSPRSRRPSTTP